MQKSFIFFVRDGITFVTDYNSRCVGVVGVGVGVGMGMGVGVGVADKAGRQSSDASSFIFHTFIQLFILFLHVRKKQGTDRQMYTASYRDARTHLKMGYLECIS